MLSAGMLVLLLACAGTAAVVALVALVALVACAGVVADDDGVVNNLFQKVNEVYDPD